ncbi:Z1 domain-containing protein [Halomonas salifodinae]|uniref:Z1 domain-containing protein n=1 Tax=Halomonas salifodinae TaxID=438745 RepID=UPI0033AC85D5
MSSTQVERFANQIREKLPVYGSPEKCAEKVREDAEALISPLPDKVLNDIDAAYEVVKASFSEVEILRPYSLIKPREDWYHGPQPHHRHWPALDRYLREVKGWDQLAVDSIGKTSNEVVSLLGNPGKQTYRERGLVVGYVQSGKTANMTAVIAKAVDAGYNLIVLLGGMTNKLRAQTQLRLESDIVGRHRELWQLYTTSDDDGDFVIPKNSSFTMPVQGRAQLAVLKKVSSRLDQFLKTIELTPPTILQKLKVLLIDDECDQASVNAAKREYDMTTINELIRRIIRKLPSVSYVGYTATPFANVFINPYPPGKEELDDLYPEDFITALPKPEAYFGAREVFGDDPVDPGEEAESGHDMIRLIESKEELARLRAEKSEDVEDFHPAVTDSLEHAILWFIGSCAVRRRRGHDDRHMSMLVHTSPRVRQHDRMADAIEAWIERHGGGLRQGSGSAFDALARVMEEEFDRVAPYRDKHEIRPAAGELVEDINEVLDALEVVVENGESFRRLDYTGEAKTYIVVGGAVLARGLTLEGLSVSFFLRTSRQYDTLLQMGRWFGYRHGYEDMPRLWTTPDLADSFRQLARVEEEIREDIEKYKTHNVTPKDFAVRVRSIPGMAITSATKMKHAYRIAISFAGRHVQTIRFDHRDDDIVRGNWKAASQLVDEIGADRFTEGKGRLASSVDGDKVRRFLIRYDIASSHLNLKKDHLLEYIDKQADRLVAWNVGIVLSAKGERSTHDLGGLGRVTTVNRSRLKDTEGGYADIKALMSRSDILIDADARPDSVRELGWAELKEYRPDCPLLLLYPICAESSPDPKNRGAVTKTRAPLDAVDDLLGIAIVFPGEELSAGNYYAVELDSPTPEQLDDEDDIEVFDQPDGAELINE